MSRRRYLSTDISTDTRINRLAEQSDFAALLYTWMIPHASDAGTLPGDPEELMLIVVPGRRSRTVEEVAEALRLMAALDLIGWDGQEVTFPAASFYRYQTYVQEAHRRKTPGDGDDQRTSAQNTGDQRKTPEISGEPRESAQNAASVKPSVKPSPSFNPPAPTEQCAPSERVAAAAAPAPAPGTLKIVATPAKPAPKPNKLGDVVDAIRAAGGEVTTSARDGKAVKDCSASAQLIADAYLAASRGEWGDDFTRRNLALWFVCSRIDGYRAHVQQARASPASAAARFQGGKYGRLVQS